MIETLKTKNGFVYAYMEWTTMMMNGIPIDHGPRVHIKELWVHDRFRGDTKLIRTFINKVKDKVPQSKTLTWERSTKYPGREQTVLTREETFKHLVKESHG